MNADIDSRRPKEVDGLGSHDVLLYVPRPQTPEAWAAWTERNAAALAVLSRLPDAELLIDMLGLDEATIAKQIRKWTS